MEYGQLEGFIVWSVNQWVAHNPSQRFDLFRCQLPRALLQEGSLSSVNFLYISICYRYLSRCFLFLLLVHILAGVTEKIVQTLFPYWGMRVFSFSFSFFFLVCVCGWVGGWGMVYVECLVFLLHETSCCGIFRKLHTV